MSFGTNLQYLRRLDNNMTQEALAEKLNVSRQTISKWEMDAATPEMDKAIELCRIFSVSLDNLFRENIDEYNEDYTNLRVEEVEGFRYIKHAVLSSDPEGDAIDRVFEIAKENGCDNPKVIGWDFPHLTPEQISVFNMHGYEAAWVLPEGVTPEDREIFSQRTHKYAAIHVNNPFENPFTKIPGAYKTLMDYMRVNGLEGESHDVIPCFEVDGEHMDIYIACKE